MMTAEQVSKRREWLRYHLASLRYGSLPKVEYRALERAVAKCRWNAAYRLITIIATQPNHIQNFKVSQIRCITAQLKDDDLSGPTFKNVYEMLQELPDCWWKREYLYALQPYYYAPNPSLA